ncbi:MAG: HTTM domain protein [Candidatus Peregrinibacteria bacterium Greene1014_49]|nr:MAG: HTTM domain protein [Candidatus Peregrinibacteria bacterium Greene1014_49]
MPETFFHHWDRWWTRTVPPHALALFRIAFGLFLLLYFGMQIPHIAMLYSREGLLIPAFTPDRLHTVIFTPPPAWAAHILFAVFTLFLISFTVGLCTRVSAGVSFILYFYYWILSLFQFGASFDRLFIFSLLVMAFSGCGETLSVDVKLRHGKWTAWEPVSILPQRILSLQIAVTYFGVGWQKLLLPAWQSGTILSYGFIGLWGTAPAYSLVRLNLPLWFYDALNWLIKAFEISLPFGLWSRRYQKWFFLGGAIFHILIAVLLAIWWFLALIPAYILFVEPEEVLRRFEKIKGHF